MIARRAVPLFAVVTLLASALALGLSHGTARAEPKPPKPQKPMYFVPACTHDGGVLVSTYRCRDTMTTVFHTTDVRSAVLTVTLNDGKQYTQVLPPGTDAVFMSDTAIVKFLLPYYQRVGDRKRVADLRSFISQLGHMEPGKPQPTSPKQP